MIIDVLQLSEPSSLAISSGINVCIDAVCLSSILPSLSECARKYACVGLPFYDSRQVSSHLFLSHMHRTPETISTIPSLTQLCLNDVAIPRLPTDIGKWVHSNWCITAWYGGRRLLQLPCYLQCMYCIHEVLNHCVPTVIVQNVVVCIHFGLQWNLYVSRKSVCVH